MVTRTTIAYKFITITAMGGPAESVPHRRRTERRLHYGGYISSSTTRALLSSLITSLFFSFSL